MTLTRNFNELQQLIAEDVANERVIQGSYWDPEKQHGCYIGCLTRGGDPVTAERQWGIPVMLQRIAEGVFEALPAEDARAFFAALPEAVACDGKDLARVGWQFLAAELRSLPPQPLRIQAVVDPVITGLDLLAEGHVWSEAANAAGEAAAEAAGEARAARLTARRRQRDTLLRLIKEAPVQEAASHG